MVDLVYQRKKKLQIYLVAFVLLACMCILVACNSDNSYSVEGDTVAEPTHFMAKLMLSLQNSVGGNVSFGWVVVAFTVILRVILSPLDIWQKMVARRNAKAMKRMKPQLEALQAKYGDDKQRMQQEQMALYKKEKYSMMGMCLPTIVTFVVFFVVFAGFRQMVGYQWAQDYKNSYNVYETALSEQIEAKYGKGEDGIANLDDIPKTEEGAAFYTAAKEVAQRAVYDSYYSEEQKSVRSFLWIKNIFVSDNWSTEVPNFEVVTGQSGFATSKLTGITIDEYNDVMGGVIGTGGYGKNGKWNGLLILPVLSILLSFLSTKLLSNAQGQPPAPQMTSGDDKGKEGGKPADQMQSMKAMQYMMPIMMGVFALLYSGAFALYMFTSSLTAILFQLTFNLFAKIADRKEEVENPYVAKR